MKRHYTTKQPQFSFHSLINIADKLKDSGYALQSNASKNSNNLKVICRKLANGTAYGEISLLDKTIALEPVANFAIPARSFEETFGLLVEEYSRENPGLLLQEEDAKSEL